jgi:hypothetical protein
MAVEVGEISGLGEIIEYNHHVRREKCLETN